ncbi:hypothetical protein GCM10007884_31010 [Methylobacterium brachythecii]|nr:hypothetical protein GCM10007884_31010 [Methylobacterium brachythecii]
MRKSGLEDTQGWVIDPQLWVDEWRRIHPVKTAQCVAEQLNAPVRTVEKWLSGESRPSFDWFGPILCAYGLGFVAAGMPNPAPWLDDHARDERRAAILAKRQALDEQLAADWNRRANA